MGSLDGGFHGDEMQDRAAAEAREEKKRVCVRVVLLVLASAHKGLKKIRYGYNTLWLTDCA